MPWRVTISKLTISRSEAWSSIPVRATRVILGAGMEHHKRESRSDISGVLQVLALSSVLVGAPLACAETSERNTEANSSDTAGAVAATSADLAGAFPVQGGTTGAYRPGPHGGLAQPCYPNGSCDARLRCDPAFVCRASEEGASSGGAGGASSGDAGRSADGDAGNAGSESRPAAPCFGSREVYDNAAFAALVAENCSSIEGELTLASYNGTEGPASLVGLSSLTSVGANVTIGGFSRLTDLAGLEQLESIGGTLEIQEASSLVSIAALSSLKRLGGLSLMNDRALPSVAPLAQVKGASFYDLTIIGDNALTSLIGLEGVAAVTSDITITDNARLTSIAALQNAESLGGWLTIDHNPQLTTLDGLSNLTRARGIVLTRTGLTTLSGLQGIQQVQYYVVIAGTALTSLEPLHSWPKDAVGGSLVISDNPLLPACEVERLDQELSAACSDCKNNSGTEACL